MWRLSTKLEIVSKNSMHENPTIYGYIYIYIYENLTAMGVEVPVRIRRRIESAAKKLNLDCR